jgi:hypothetical protein
VVCGKMQTVFVGLLLLQDSRLDDDMERAY